MAAALASLAGAFGGRELIGVDLAAKDLIEPYYGGRSHHAFSYHAERGHWRTGARSISAAAAKRAARKRRNIRARSPK